MNMNDQDFKTVAYDGHVSVWWSGERTEERGTASADRMHDGSGWWVNRVLVVPSEARGRGIGTVLVMRLQHEIKAQGGTRVVVAPGGYDMTPERQVAFYVRCGFREEHGKFGPIYVWSP